MQAADVASASGRAGIALVPRFAVRAVRRNTRYASKRPTRAIGLALVVAAHVAAIYVLWHIGPARNAIVAASPVIVPILPLPKPDLPPPEPPKRVVKPKQPLPAPTARETVVERPPPPVAPAEAAPPAITLPEPAPAPPVEVAMPPAGEVAPPPVTPPRFDAEYLRNPSPSYPAMSRRHGEQGRVILRVLVDPEGSPREIDIKTSSGHERLDRAALETVRQWKFIPARVGKEPVSAWVLVPVSFALER